MVQIFELNNYRSCEFQCCTLLSDVTFQQEFWFEIRNQTKHQIKTIKGVAILLENLKLIRGKQK